MGGGGRAVAEVDRDRLCSNVVNLLVMSSVVGGFALNRLEEKVKNTFLDNIIFAGNMVAVNLCAIACVFSALLYHKTMGLNAKTKNVWVTRNFGVYKYPMIAFGMGVVVYIISVLFLSYRDLSPTRATQLFATIFGAMAVMMVMMTAVYVFGFSLRGDYSTADEGEPTTDRDRLCSNVANLGVVSALISGFALDRLAPEVQNNFLDNFIYTGNVVAVHLCTCACLMSAFLYHKTMELPAQPMGYWVTRNSKLFKVPMWKFGAGCVVYILSVLFLSYRDLRASPRTQCFSTILGCMSVTIVLSVAVFVFGFSPPDDYSVEDSRRDSEGASEGVLSVDRERLCNNIANLNVVSALVGGFALDNMKPAEDTFLDNAVYIGNCITVHMCTCACLTSAFLYHKTMGLTTDKMNAWVTRNYWIFKVPMFGFGMGSVTYLLSVTFLSYRDLAPTRSTQMFATVLGALTVMSVMVVSIYVFFLSPKADYSIDSSTSTVDRSRLCSNIAILNVVSAIVGGFALEHLGEKVKNNFLDNAIYTGNIIAVHLCTSACFTSAALYHKTMSLTAEKMGAWVTHNAWIFSVSMWKFGMGCAIYILGVVFLSYRDLEGTKGSQLFATVFGACTVLMVTAMAIYVFGISPGSSYRAERPQPEPESTSLMKMSPGHVGLSLMSSPLTLGDDSFDLREGSSPGASRSTGRVPQGINPPLRRGKGRKGMRCTFNPNKSLTSSRRENSPTSSRLEINRLGNRQGTNLSQTMSFQPRTEPLGISGPDVSMTMPSRTQGRAPKSYRSLSPKKMRFDATL
eukprot:Hpha_TRINITY_DN23385_c0_g1::TRINITY_DN23385_c0_g1_i1::g.96947::m.96947